MALEAQYGSSTAPRPPNPRSENLSLSEWIYTTAWVPFSDRTEQRETAGSASAVAWTLLPSASTLKVSGQWAEQLRKQGSQVQELNPSAMEFSADDELVQHLVKQIGGHAAGHEERRELVFFLGDESAESQVARAVSLGQVLLQQARHARVWFVAQLSAAGMLSVPAAALRGFSRSLGLEQPAISGGWVALDPDTTPSAAIAAIANAGDEDMLWLQNGTVLVPHLRRKVLSEGAVPALKADRFYLVTGAFGRLGRGIVDWLASCGARHIVMIGRNPPDEAEVNWHRRRRAWEAQGIHLRVEACDVADEPAMRRVFACIAEKGKPIAGVVHAAGAVQFAPLSELRETDVVTAFRAKVEGARVLDRCTRAMQLDLFILFGSASATVGLRDGMLYAAANSCLDALAVERRSLGLAAMCVEWGLWKAGTLSVANTQLERIASSGFGAMEDAGAFGALNAILSAGYTTAVVADIDWAVLGPALRSLHRGNLAGELLATTQASGPQAVEPIKGTPWLESIRQLPPEERYAQLRELVAEKVAEVCGLSSASEVSDAAGFFDLGLESLTGIELQTHIEDTVGIRMQGTLTLNYPNIAVLTRFLDDTLFGSTTPSRPLKKPADSVSSAPPLATSEEPEAEAMSDDEVQRAIREELAAIEKLGMRSA
jgi:NAD(P)-dependent dehydrogenase (short-subunit alcohol dehydrogenase family)/acyl carrier protein